MVCPAVIGMVAVPEEKSPKMNWESDVTAPRDAVIAAADAVVLDTDRAWMTSTPSRGAVKEAVVTTNEVVVPELVAPTAKGAAESALPGGGAAAVAVLVPDTFTRPGPQKFAVGAAVVV